MNAAELYQKFLKLSRGKLDSRVVEEVIMGVDNLESLENIHALLMKLQMNERSET